MRSLALNLEGWSALRSRAYDVVWKRAPDSISTVVFSPSPLSVAPPDRVNLSKSVRLSSKSKMLASQAPRTLARSVAHSAAMSCELNFCFGMATRSPMS